MYVSRELPGRSPAAQAEVRAALRYFATLRKKRAGIAVVDRTRDTQEAASRAAASLLYFTESAWPLVEPELPFVSNWHIVELCQALERASRGEKDWRQLVVNIPPGCMKSLLVSVMFCAWEWATRPHLRFYTWSHSLDLTKRDNGRVRLIVSSDWYRRWFWNSGLAKKYGVPEIKLKGDQNEKLRFETTVGGYRVASSVGGAGIGEHPDRRIIDDPQTERGARSAVDREAVLKWYRGTVVTRGATRDAVEVVIQQRLHEQDLSGHLMGSGSSRSIVLPMRFDPSRADPLDHRKEAGELLWPTVWTDDRVRPIEIELGEYGRASQFQQLPVPEGGGLFKEEWFEIVEPGAVPDAGTDVRGWDTGASDDGDPSATVKMRRVVTPGVSGAPARSTFYILHAEARHTSPAQLEAWMRNMAVTDGKRVRIREEQEPGSSGKIVVASRAQLLVGYDYRGNRPGGDKVTRSGPFRAQCEAGNVKLVRGPWNRAYIDELIVFPTGAHDDQVDASSCAFNAVAPVKSEGMVHALTGEPIT